MSDRSAIEWTDASWNPIRARNLTTGKVGWHCEHATTGCEHCYSEGFNKRLGTGLPFKPGHRKDIEIFLDEEMLTQPLRWKKPRKIFVCSMMDLFADFVTDEMLDKMFAVMALCPQHTFQVLTKRAKRMREWFQPLRSCRPRWDLVACEAARIEGRPDLDRRVLSWPLPNVWLGVSAERQREADERIPELLGTPAAIRFISAEPLLGPIDLLGTLCRFQDNPKRVCAVRLGGQLINWVTVGGESGRNARSMHPDWARSLRDCCLATGMAFFFKQWGEWAPSSPEQAADNLHSGWQVTSAHPHVARAAKLYPEAGAKFVARIGKKAAGRLLDGLEHNAFPVTESHNGV